MVEFLEGAASVIAILFIIYAAWVMTCGFGKL